MNFSKIKEMVPVLIVVVCSILVAITIVFLLPSCLPAQDGCVANAQRCSGNVAEVCNADSTWVTSEDCNQTAQISGGTWVCCDLPDGDAGIYTCLPDFQTDGVCL